MKRYRAQKVPTGAHLRYFHLLNTEEQAQAVKRLIQSHQTDAHVAELTGLSVEQVRRIVAQP
jgi:hypothetical protein